MDVYDTINSEIIQVTIKGQYASSSPSKAFFLQVCWTELVTTTKRAALLNHLLTR